LGGGAFELRVPELELYGGQFMALVGESGCGKSTLLDLLALVLRPTSVHRFNLYDRVGSRLIDVGAMWRCDDQDGLARQRRELLGYVLQSGGLLPFLSVRKNLYLPRRLKSGSGSDVAALAARMGIDNLMERKPASLSGGQRQRVAILRALAHQPAIILADEPTAAVDRGRARSIVADFSVLAREEGCGIVMVSHDLQLVEEFADRIFGYRLETPKANLTVSTCVERI
jgi:putative ABC transport system ATP-binding protein